MCGLSPFFSLASFFQQSQYKENGEVRYKFLESDMLNYLTVVSLIYEHRYSQCSKRVSFFELNVQFLHKLFRKYFVDFGMNCAKIFNGSRISFSYSSLGGFGFPPPQAPLPHL